MRTTVRLDDDVLAAANSLRREKDLSLSQAVNTLARTGLLHRDAAPRPFVQRTAHLGLMIDVSNVAEALDLLDGVDHA
jgi:hypothetical protein